MIVTTLLTRSDLERIAATMNVEVVNYTDKGTVKRGPRAGCRRHSFVLRPLRGADDYRKMGEGHSAYVRGEMRVLVRPKRLWACSWAGHYVFMRAVFVLDPGARIKTGAADYDGESAFLDLAPGTRDRFGVNTTADAGVVCQMGGEAPGHVQWAGIPHLDDIARRVAA